MQKLVAIIKQKISKPKQLLTQFMPLVSIYTPLPQNPPRKLGDFWWFQAGKRTTGVKWVKTISVLRWSSIGNYYVLRDLVLSVQFKKRENTHGEVLLLVKLQAFSL